MIKHIVVWRILDEALGAEKAENLARMKSCLEALRYSVPDVRHLEVGIDIGAAHDSWDIVIYSEFDTREALDAYQVHPEHLKAAALVADIRELRAAIDYEV